MAKVALTFTQTEAREGPVAKALYKVLYEKDGRIGPVCKAVPAPGPGTSDRTADRPINAPR